MAVTKYGNLSAEDRYRKLIEEMKAQRLGMSETQIAQQMGGRFSDVTADSIDPDVDEEGQQDEFGETGIGDQIEGRFPERNTLDFEEYDLPTGDKTLEARSVKNPPSQVEMFPGNSRGRMLGGAPQAQQPAAPVERPQERMRNPLDLLSQIGPKDEDERTKRIKNLLQQHLYDRTPQQAKTDSDTNNLNTLMGRMSQAQSKIGTLGGKEAGSGLPQGKYGTVRPQINVPIAKALISKPYQGMNPNLLLSLEKFMTSQGNRQQDISTRAENREQDVTTRDANRQQDLALKREAIDKQDARYADEQKVKHDAKMQKHIEKFSKDSAHAKDIAANLREVENVLGFRLDDLKTSGKKVLGPDGREIDLPGVSVPGVGRTYIGGGADLQRAIENMVAYHRNKMSGSAVSSQEMKNIMIGFGNSIYATEAGMVRALQSYKKALRGQLKAYRLKFPPEAMQILEDRGGYVGKDLDPVQTKMKKKSARQKPTRRKSKKEGLQFRVIKSGRTITVSPLDPRFTEITSRPDLFQVLPYGEEKENAK